MILFIIIDEFAVNLYSSTCKLQTSVLDCDEPIDLLTKTIYSFYVFCCILQGWFRNQLAF